MTAAVAYSPIEDMDLDEFRDALADPVWRLNNLYKILVKEDDDDDGLVLTFKPNRAQRRLMKRLWHRNLILKARQLGFTTFICILFLDYCLFTPNLRSGIIAHTDDAAKAIFRDKVKFAYEHLPPALREAMPLKRDAADELVFANNSSIRVSTSMRSGTLQLLHVSEFGKICARFPHRATEVVTGSIPTVPLSGMVFIESTAEGREGKFFQMSQRAERLHVAGSRLTKKDYRFHFYAWWEAPEYRMSPQDAADTPISAEEHEYFDTVELEIGRKLDLEQRAWWIATRDSDFSGDDALMWQEYPSTPKEAFQQSTEGAYYTKQLLLARKEKRITRVPFSQSHTVNTFWDIGLNDEMAIWFHQQIGPQHRFIRYYENSGESFEHYVQYMNSLGYTFGQHYLPHDGDTERLGIERNWTPRQMLTELGLRNIIIVPRIPRIQTGINMTRDVIGQCWFDEEGCKLGLDRLQNYRKEWNERLGVWKDEPRHDTASNGADAFRQFAQGYQTGPVGGKLRRKGTNWRTV